MTRLLLQLAIIGLGMYCGIQVHADYRQEQIDGITYGIFEACPRRVSLHWQDSEGNPYRYLGRLNDALIKQHRRVLMLMNAGIFSKNHYPAGLWVEHGHLLHPLNRKDGKGNFHIQPNGVFWLKDGRAHINTTESYLQIEPHPDYAVQSGPMLVIDGQINRRFNKGLSSPHKRNAVCLTKNNALLFIMTETVQEEWPSLYQLASALKDIGCQQALYLDGSLSSWYVPGISSPFHWADFVGMIAVTTAE